MPLVILQMLHYPIMPMILLKDLMILSLALKLNIFQIIILFATTVVIFIMTTFIMTLVFTMIMLIHGLWM
ncbi:hypothetical protein ES703_65969 [subsurface metagenome]